MLTTTLTVSQQHALHVAKLRHEREVLAGTELSLLKRDVAQLHAGLTRVASAAAATVHHSAPPPPTLVSDPTWNERVQELESGRRVEGAGDGGAKASMAESWSPPFTLRMIRSDIHMLTLPGASSSATSEAACGIGIDFEISHAFVVTVTGVRLHGPAASAGLHLIATGLCVLMRFELCFLGRYPLTRAIDLLCTCMHATNRCSAR